MPRVNRVDVGGEIYHVINRANARMQIFYTPAETSAIRNSLDSVEKSTRKPP